MNDGNTMLSYNESINNSARILVTNVDRLLSVQNHLASIKVHIKYNLFDL